MEVLLRNLMYGAMEYHFGSCFLKEERHILE